MPLNDNAYRDRRPNGAGLPPSFFETRIDRRLAYTLRILIAAISVLVWYHYTFYLSVYWFLFGSIPTAILVALLLARVGFRYESVRWMYYTLLVFAATPFLFIALGIEGGMTQL
jgi:hypothetical protein